MYKKMDSSSYGTGRIIRGEDEYINKYYFIHQPQKL
jgi:hypothetical protein